jgi:hypothetical protein
MAADTRKPHERCLFVETPASGDGTRCPAEPAYKLWIEGCQPCKEGGLRMGISSMDCVGHWACVQHGAEVRIGKLTTPCGAGLTVRRIQSLGAARPGALA